MNLFKKKKYAYYIVFGFHDGCGWRIVELDHKIKTDKDLEDVAELIKSSHFNDTSDRYQIIITYWKRIKVRKDDK